jgi:hypothetical protein
VEDSSGGRYTCRQAGPGEGSYWKACAGGPAARSASLAHRTSSHVTSCRSTSRPERRASHHATRSGPAHMSMSEVLRARTTMFACAGVCRHFSEPAASHENGITITNQYQIRKSASHVADAVARPRFHRRPRLVDGDARALARAPPFPNAHCQNCSLHANPPVPERPRHTGTHRRKHRRAAAVCRGAFGRDHSTSNNTVTNGAGGRTTSFAAKHA